MNVRKLIYLTKDFLINNNGFNKNTLELKSEFNSNFKSHSENLSNIVNYAINKTAYYKVYSDYNEFNLFPILDKANIKRQYEDFISSDYKEKLNSLRRVTTSGSYGTPFSFYLNDRKRHKVISEVYFFGAQSNFSLGDKHAYLIAKKKSKASQTIQNQLMLTVNKLDDEWCQSAIKELSNNKVKILVGYPSAISRIAHYLLQEKISLPMKGIITIAEVLSDEARDSIEKAFNCAPISRYSTEEFGVLANQDISGDFFLLNQCNYFIEILKMDSDSPAKIGELGRVIVTDYYNEAMPLIRYDTGDLARPYEIIDNIVTKIESVEGRVLAVIRNTRGEVISSFVINGALRESRNIVQFQFSQDEVNKYNLKIVRKDKVNEEEIIKKYKNILGEDAEICILYVDDIPPQASGKRPYIIQNYY